MPSEWDVKRNEKGKKLAKELTDYVNDMGFKQEPFADELLNCSHRTLQQSAMKMMYFTIAEMAKKYRSGMFDLRNEQACKTADEIDRYMASISPLGEKWWYCPCI